MTAAKEDNVEHADLCTWRPPFTGGVGHNILASKTATAAGFCDVTRRVATGQNERHDDKSRT